MKARTFTLRLDRDTGRLDDAEMAEFLEEHDATALSEHMVQIDGEPALVVVVRWRPAGRGGVARVGEAGRRSRAPAEDPRAALDPAEQAAYDALRTWRNDRAKRSGKPSYALFNNRQMAELVGLLAGLPVNAQLAPAAGTPATSSPPDRAA